MKKIKLILLSFLFILGSIFLNYKSLDAASYVANVRLYSTLSDNHSWLVVKNTSSSNIYVGGYKLTPNSTVTIGTWGNISQHTGIWYNLEGKYSMSSHVSIGKDITSSQLTSMNSTINSKDKWSAIYNCSSFAKDVWNSISTTPVSAGLVNTPSNLANSIKSIYRNSFSSNYSIPSKTNSNLAYYSTSSSVIYQIPTFKTGNGNGSMNLNNIDELMIDYHYITSFK